MHKGFTLVETLVAITIITLAVLAPFQVVQNVFSASRLAKENLIASSLADEALEYVRFVRMNNYLANPTGYIPLDGINGTNGPNCTNATGCTLDATVAPSSAFAACGGSCTPLYLNTASGFYTMTSSGATQTIYTRKIVVASFAGYEQATVTISWTDKGAHSIVLTENYYDWL